MQGGEERECEREMRKNLFSSFCEGYDFTLIIGK